VAGSATGARASTSARTAREGARKVQSNGASTSGRVRAAPIAPGAPIAAVLMRGDMNVAATGTVTFVDGDEVLGFGHPFLGFGHVVFPMATASILNTLATPLGSYKMGSTALEVGSITHDRLTTIAGSLGGAAPMIPVRVRIDRGAGAEGRSEAEVEIVDDPIWLPMLLDAIVASSAAGRLGYEAGGTVDLVATIQVGDRTLRFEDTYSDEAPSRVSSFASRDVATTLAILARNDLERPKLRAVDVSLRVRSDVELARIERVVPDRRTVRPGDTLGLTVTLRPYMKNPVTARIAVKIPEDASGELEVYVGGGIELDRRDGDVWGDRIPQDLDQLLGILADRRPARALFARTYQARPGLRTNAELLSSLPPSQRAALGADTGRLTKPVAEVMGPAASVPFDGVVAGGHAVAVTVVR
ncbi:hypothetical protein L6R52_34940, partial [Myxococcota bacterium]|nr:hypothetical protein [Myxococcota bacterium]